MGIFSSIDRAMWNAQCIRCRDFFMSGSSGLWILWLGVYGRCCGACFNKTMKELGK